MTKMSEVLVENFYEPIVPIQETATVRELVAKMRNQKTTYMAVVDENNNLKGGVFDVNLIKIIKQGSVSPIAGSVWADTIEKIHAEKKVKEIMDTKMATVKKSDTVMNALRIMNSNEARILTVVDDNGKYLGVLRIRTIFEKLLREIE